MKIQLPEVVANGRLNGLLVLSKAQIDEQGLLSKVLAAEYRLALSLARG